MATVTSDNGGLTPASQVAPARPPVVDPTANWQQIGPDLYIAEIEAKDLKEQDVNAHTMPPAVFERLVENIQRRGALESLPYCAMPNRKGPVEIVSGHHRVRAARAAGIERFSVMVDTAQMTRSQIIAKQLAHNALVGMDDEDLVRQLAKKIESPDDMLETGLPETYFGDPEDNEKITLFTPRVDFDFRTVSFAFLPHQQRELERLIDLLDGRQDLVVACPDEQFDLLLRTAARFARIKKVKSGGSAVALLIQVALAEIEAAEAEEAEQEAKKAEKNGRSR